MPTRILKDLHLASSLQELNKMVGDMKPSGDVKLVSKSCNKLLKEADLKYLMCDEEMAYVLYMRFAGLCTFIRKTKEFSSDAPYYTDISGMSSLKTVLTKAEELSQSLSARYNDREDLALAEKVVTTLNNDDVPKPSLLTNGAEVEIFIKPQMLLKLADSLLSAGKSKILLLDIRVASDFCASSVLHDYIDVINIPSDILQPGATASYVHLKLDENNKSVWNSRRTRDHIVIMDQASQSTQMPPAALVLSDALTKFDSVALKCNVIQFVVGGFYQWSLSYPQHCTKLVQIDYSNDQSESAINLNFQFPSMNQIRPKPVAPAHSRAVENVNETKQRPVVNRAVKPSSVAADSVDRNFVQKDSTGSSEPISRQYEDVANHVLRAGQQLEERLEQSRQAAARNKALADVGDSKSQPSAHSAASPEKSVVRPEDRKPNLDELRKYKNQTIKPSLPQSDSRPKVQTDGLPNVQTDGLPMFETDGLPRFQTDGLAKFQTNGSPKFQTDDSPKFQIDDKSKVQTDIHSEFDGIPTSKQAVSQVQPDSSQLKQRVAFTDKPQVDRQVKPSVIIKPANAESNATINTPSVILPGDNDRAVGDKATSESHPAEHPEADQVARAVSVHSEQKPNADIKSAANAGHVLVHKGVDAPPPKGDFSATGESNLRRSRSFSNLAPNAALPRRPQPAIDRNTKPVGTNITSSAEVENQKSEFVKFYTRKRNFYPVYGCPGRGLTGLKNLGNTCYMNATLQAISFTAGFRHYLDSQKYRNDVNYLNADGTSGRIIEECAQLMRVLWCNEYKSVAPKSFLDTVSTYSKLFGSGDQQDSHEFLSFLLDKMHEDVNRVLKRPQLAAIADAEWDAMSLHQTAQVTLERDKLCKQSVVVDLFQGWMLSRLRCETCRKESYKFDPFLTLSLELPSGAVGRISLEDCLMQFMREERLTGDSRWLCPSCKQRRDATKRILLWSLPPILVITLKRFHAAGLFNRKIANFVDFPITSFSTDQYVQAKGQWSGVYNLYAVTNHYGSLETGHYTAFCSDLQTRRWYRFDDQQVTAISESGVRSTAAYTLFYCRT